uniref:Apple domain-containing protein n=1 Tax=Caenorhabditis japonica TaxID=281687 RepID=A0A8R1HJA7_CAEJA
MLKRTICFKFGHYMHPPRSTSSSSALYRSKDVFSCFDLHSNEFLEKSGNVLIENIDDVNECLRKCIQAPLHHKLRCKTVMYNVNTQNCVLSKYARHERSVKKSKGLQIDMYENKCASSENETVRLAIFTEQVRTTAAPLKTFPAVNLNFSLPTWTSTPKSATTTTPSSAIPTTNELRRVHAVKQFPLEPRRENFIYSKTVYAEQTAQFSPKFVEKRTRNARVFLSPRPLVDSTSWVVMTPPPPQPPPQFDETLVKERRQRSDRVSENLAACFVKTPQRNLIKFEENRIGGVTLETCMRQCAAMTQFYCASINYSFNLRVCILNGGSVHLNGAETLMMSRDFDYHENTCQPRGTTTTTESSTNGVSSTKKECYRLYSNSIYNSFDATIVGGLMDLASCESECSWSHIRRREKCMGVNWIERTRGCMLFYKQVDYNILQPSLGAVFLANTCTYTTDETSSSSSSSSKSGDSDYYDS